MAYLRNARKKRKKRTSRRSGVAQAALGRKPTRGHTRKERGYNVAKGHSRKSKHRSRSRNPISPTNPFGSKQGGPPPGVSADQWDDAWRSATSAARRMWLPLQKAAGAINFDLTPEDMDRGIEQTAAVIMLAPYPSMINATAWSGTKDNKYPLASHADKTPPMAAVEVLGGHHPFAAELQAAEEEEEPTVLSSTWETQAEKLAKLIQSKRKVEQEKRAPQAKARKKAERTAKRKASGAGPTVAELRAMAKKLGLKGAYKWKRDELIAELEEWQRPEEPEDPEYEPEEEEYEPEYEEEEETYEVSRRPSRAPRAPRAPSGRAAERLGELAGARVVRRTDVRPPAAMLDEASRDVLLYRLQGKEGPTQVWAKGALTETFGKHKRTDSLKVAANYAREWRKMRKSRAAARIIAGVEGDTRTRIVAGPIEAPRKAGPPPGEEKIDWSDVKGHVGLNPRRRNAKQGLVAARSYIKRIRNKKKQAYARAYLKWILAGEKGRLGPDEGDLSIMAAQGVRMELHDLLESQQNPRRRKKFREPEYVNFPAQIFARERGLMERLGYSYPKSVGAWKLGPHYDGGKGYRAVYRLPGKMGASADLEYIPEEDSFQLRLKEPYSGPSVVIDERGEAHFPSPRVTKKVFSSLDGALKAMRKAATKLKSNPRRRKNMRNNPRSRRNNSGWTKADEARLKAIEAEIKWLGSHEAMMLSGLLRYNIPPLQVERDELLQKKKAAQRGNPRQISVKAARALAEFRPFKRGNTEVRQPHTAGDPSVLYLHGNAIAEILLGQGLFITDAGHPTSTTKERLSALPGVQVHTRRGQLYLNGKKWSGDWVRVDPEGNVYELGTNPRRRKNTAIKVGDRIRFPRGEEGEVTEITDGWGYVVFEVVLMEGWFSVSSLSKLERVPPPRRHNASGGISEEEARLQLREILRGRRTSRPKESMAAAAMKRSHKEGLSLGESWATLKSEAGIPHEFNPGGKKDRPRYGPRPSTHREVSFRDFKPLAPSKRSKALQKELKLHRPSAGVGTWASQAKRAGYMAYEKAGSRAKPKRGEFAKERKAGIESARYTEYKFRYPSERDLERKEQKEREKSEKYRLRRRLEQLERGPWRERGGYQSFSKKRKLNSRRRKSRLPGATGSPPFYRDFRGETFELYLWEPPERKRFLAEWKDDLLQRGHRAHLVRSGSDWALYWKHAQKARGG